MKDPSPEPRTVLADAIEKKGLSLRALARELAEDESRSAETWRRSLYQYLAEVIPEPEHAERMADVLGLPQDLWNGMRAARRRGAGRAALGSRLDDFDERLARVEEATASRARRQERREKRLDDLVRRLTEAGVLPDS